MDSIKVSCYHIAWEDCAEDWNGGLEGPFLKTRVPLQRNILSAASFIDGQVHALENRFGAEVGGYKFGKSNVAFTFRASDCGCS